MKMNRRIPASVLAALAWLLAPGVALASFGFDELMARLSEHPRFTAEFDEQRSSFLLARPIALSGKIRFDADASLEKIVDSPFEEHIIIDNEAVVIHRINSDGKAANRQTTRYEMASYPFLAKAVQGVSNVFSGDKELLEELYDHEVSGSEQDWQLVLTPSDKQLAEFITSITIRGSGGVIDYIHSLEADGDESKLTLANRTEP